MKLNIFEILLFLYQSYLQKNGSPLPELEKWLHENSNVKNINTYEDKAYLNQNASFLDFNKTNSTRIYSHEETTKINEICQGYLLTLEQHNLISPHTREKIIQDALTANQPLDQADIEYIAQELINEELFSVCDLSNSQNIFDEYQNQILH